MTGLAALTIAGCLFAPVGAAASSAAPQPPTHVHVVRATHHSFTVKVKGNAARYRLYAGHTKPEIAVVRLGSAQHSKWTRHRTITITGLKYSTAPLFFRVQAQRGSRHAYSPIQGTASLRPAAPTSLQATGVGTSGSLSLSWDSGPATGYSVEQASDVGFTQGDRTYRIHGPDRQFTPYGLTVGKTYYFRVRATNGATRSKPTAVVSAATTARQQPMRLMTYNLREAYLDNSPDGNNQGAPWSQRRFGVARFVEEVKPDAIAIQEGAAYVDSADMVRQVDDVVSLLDTDGLDYKVARTEIPPGEPHHHRYADYVVYNADTYQAVGDGGHWELSGASTGHDRWAAYQILANKVSGAKVLYVSLHLRVQNTGRSDDQIRQLQTETLISKATAFADAHHVPVVYAGDTNSNGSATHVFDGPRVAFRAAGIDDAAVVAQSRNNAKYTTTNSFSRRPPAHALYVDDVFTSPGVAVTSWEELLRVRHGKFVGVIPSDHNPVVANVRFPF